MMATTTLERPATTRDNAPAPSGTPQKRLTFAEYMKIERDSSIKHNFIDGVMEPVWPTTNEKGEPMAGATTAHNTICGNLIASLHIALRGSGCRVLTSDQKVFIAGKYGYYPDVTVVCGTPEIAFGEALQNPLLIVEVLSPSTQDKDFGTKFRDYRAIATLRHYILVAQFTTNVEHWQCDENNRWSLNREHKLLEETLEFVLTATSVKVPITDIYEHIDFDETEEMREGA
ncbi:MAG: Uma2 family endonuclease [Armatimonadetes bacterium]|nr:Uma2 family endonuclease [Armatimonadota bacterium]